MVRREEVLHHANSKYLKMGRGPAGQRGICGVRGLGYGRTDARRRGKVFPRRGSGTAERQADVVAAGATRRVVACSFALAVLRGLCVLCVETTFAAAVSIRTATSSAIPGGRERRSRSQGRGCLRSSGRRRWTTSRRRTLGRPVRRSVRGASCALRSLCP